MKKITDLFLLFISMLKIGLFTFGGGYAMIHLLENEFVSKKKWIDHEEFMEKEALSPHLTHHLIRCNGHILLRAITNQNFIIEKAETYVPAFFFILPVYSLPRSPALRTRAFLHYYFSLPTAPEDDLRTSYTLLP